jgi:hypothetical protein
MIDALAKPNRPDLPAARDVRRWHGLRRLGPVLAALLLACAGCGDDDGENSIRGLDSDVPDGGGGGDAGPRAPPPDAAPHDNEIMSGDLRLCGYDDEDVLVLEAGGEPPALAIAANEQGFALVHHDAAGALLIEAVPIAGEARPPVRILASSEGATSAALAGSETGFLLAWRSTGAPRDRLRTRELSTVENPVVELSEDLAARPTAGELFAVHGDDRGYLAAWLDEGGGNRTLRALAIGQDGTPDGDPRPLAGVAGASEAEDLQLSRFDDGRSLLTWLERNEDGTARVMGQLLGRTLAPDAGPVELSRHPVDGTRFALAGRGPSAGLLYAARDGDVREAIKFRRIEGDGRSTTAVLNIENAPGRVVSGAITAFGQGYAVAYRSLPSLGEPLPMIGVAFIDQYGSIVHRAVVAETTETSVPTAIAAGPDGHLLVAWTSEWPSGPATHALALDCPGALELCGGELQ